MYKYTCHTIHEIGQRSNQEDCIYPEAGSSSADGLFIVCDGMGGHEAGEVASAAVCGALSSNLECEFAEALERAYEALDAKDNGSEKKMGTTLAYLRLFDDHAIVAHIGDSRVYQIRPSKKRIVFMTRDHSLVNNLIAIGEITPEEARTHPQKNVITRAMQPNGERAKADVEIIDDIQDGDWFYLCSDGMLETMDDENIVNVISMRGSIEKKAEIFRSVTAEARDNHSAILVRIGAEKGKIRDFIRKTWPFIKYEK